MNAASVEPIHMAAQYLAAAGISFLDKKADDSHTNLGFSVEQQRMASRPLNDAGERFALRLQDFTLLWINQVSISQYSLNHRQHHEILSWIRTVLKDSGLADQFRYKFHYSLPYEITDNYTLLASPESLQKETRLRILAQVVISEVLRLNSMDSEIRIWPHHFDTGTHARLPGSVGLSVGIGLAIPDSVCDDYYFYISGYKDNEIIKTPSLRPLAVGEWSGSDFQGAVLKADSISETEAILFFQAAIAAFKE